MATQSITNRNTQQPSFKNFIQTPQVMKNLTARLGSETQTQEFVSTLINAVNNNSQLQKCEFGSIVNGALLGVALKLNQQLGQFSLVPYWDSKNKRFVAQFQLGYKGYIQLALRSGYYKEIGTCSIKNGELIESNPIRHKYKFEPIQDDDERDEAETTGYYVYFVMTNGCTQELYWSKKKMIKHAKKYSKAYARDLEKGTSVALWSNPDMFDVMGEKTMIRQILSKYGLLSVDLERAITGDMGVVKNVSDDKVDVDYIDNDREPQQIEQKEEFNDVKAFMDAQQKEKEPAYNENTGVVVEQDTINFDEL